MHTNWLTLEEAALVELARRGEAVYPDLELHLVTWVTVAPITSTVRGIPGEVSVGPRNGLDHDSVVSCDTITTVRRGNVGDTIGLLFDDQEPALAQAISDAFDPGSGVAAEPTADGR